MGQSISKLLHLHWIYHVDFIKCLKLQMQLLEVFSGWFYLIMGNQSYALSSVSLFFFFFFLSSTILGVGGFELFDRVHVKLHSCC